MTLLLCNSQYSLLATHVVGGEIYYTYLGNDIYEITLKVYRDCGPTNANGTGFDELASVGIFETGTGALWDGGFVMSLAEAEVDLVPIELENPCFILPPNVCVQRAVYTETVYLPPTPAGYTLVYQRCCRNPSIVNLDFPEDQGATFTTHVPGSAELDGFNSSAQFTNFPPVALCQNAEFYFDHSATDADGDSLVYEFCSPLLGATPDMPAPQPPDGPPFTPVNWANGFSDVYPITSNPAFVIDPETGYITGTATELGQFVIGICVSEYRNGVLINTTNRDFQFNVTSCDPNIIASVPEQTDFCAGLSITFENNSTNASFYHWDFGVEGIESDTSNLVSPEYTYAEQGVYIVTLVANPGWPCADTMQTTFTALPVINPQIIFGGYECINDNDYYDFGMNGNASAQATYTWDFGPGAVPSVSSDPSPQSVMMDTSVDVMSVSLVVTDNGCEESDTEEIINPPDPVASIVAQESFCEGFIYEFENNAQNAESYLWDFGQTGNSDLSTEPDPVFEFNNPGIYNVTLVVSAPFTCSDTASMPFEIFDVIDPFFEGHDPQCLELNSFDFEAQGATTPEAQYFWEFGEDANPGTSTLQNPQNVVFISANTHTVTLTISENGCSSTYEDDVLVSDHFLTSFDVNNSEGCPGLLVQLEGGAISDVPVFYIWDFGDGTTSFQGNTTHVYENPGVYDVSVTAFTTTGCLDSLTILYPGAVRIYPYPEPGFTITPQVVNIEDAVTAIADSSFGGASCYYEMSDGGESNECDFEYSWLQSGIQTITQYVTSEYGCTASVTGTVIIEGFTFYAPNTFTPNGDGLNDFWIPVMTGITDYQLKIFNRWGDLIFSTTDDKKVWMGQENDSEYYVQDGVYNYVVVASDLLLQPHEFTGHILLTR